MQYDENAEKYGYEGEMTPMKCDELNAYKGDVTIPIYGTIADAEVYLKDKADEAIAELKQKLEDVKSTHYTEMVDAGMRERRLKRALWMARALRAEAQWIRLLRDSGICFSVGKNKEWDEFNTKQKKWQIVERKCRAKAEKFGEGK